MPEKKQHGRFPFRNIWVITGDHHRPDPTKPGAVFGQADLEFDRRMREALQSIDECEFRFVNDHSLILDGLRDSPPDFVLNLCDTGYMNMPTQELHIPALLEMFGVPYSGASPAAMVLTYDKAMVRLVAAELGIAVPWEVLLMPDQSLDDVDISYPALIKPNQADGSIGITQDSVVDDHDQAQRYLDTLRDQLPGAGVLIQDYLPGAEYGLALVGNPGQGFRLLPPLELDFSRLPSGARPIQSYESKAMPDSPYYQGIGLKPADLSTDVLSDLGRKAERLFARLQCRDCARFDYRVDRAGVIKLMEVNVNPAWDDEAKLAGMARLAGLSYAGMFELLLETAARRLTGGGA